MGRRALRDELMTLLVAGQETAAVALAWACALLAHRPAVQARQGRFVASPYLGVQGGSWGPRSCRRGGACERRARARTRRGPFGAPAAGAARILSFWPAAGRAALAQPHRGWPASSPCAAWGARPVFDEPARATQLPKQI